MLISLHDKCFPKIKIKKKYSIRKPWLSDALRNSIRNKYKLYHKYKKFPTIRNETSYKLFRNKLNHVLKIAEKKYYRELIISHKDNTRKSWSIIKNIINKHRKPIIQSKFRLNDGSITDDKKVISGSFNNFIYQYWTNLSQIHPNYQKVPNRFYESQGHGTIVFEACYLRRNKQYIG